MLDKLQEVLGEELSEQVASKLSEAKIELAIMNDGSVVPADKHDTLKAEYKKLEGKYETDISDFTAKLEKASKGVEDVETIKKNLEALQGENKDLMEKYKADTLNIKIDSAIDVGLIKANVDGKYLPMLKTQINKENLTFENGELIGLTDTINKLQNDYPKMFGEVRKTGAQPNPDKKNPPMGEKAKLIEQYNSAKGLAERLAIQRKIKALKE